MNIALTSNFPLTATEAVFALMKKGHPHPRIAWIPPFTRTGRERFPVAQEQFATHGFSTLEYCDIDREVNEVQIAALDQYDVIYLTGGDPIGFRRNILRSGLSTRLRQCLDAGCLVVAASGGSMQLTKNVSLFRLVDNPFDKVFVDRREYNALGIVEYEILPHLNRLEASFLEKVRLYSEQIKHEVIGLADGAALLYMNTNEYLCVGQVTRFHNGKVEIIETNL